MRSVTVLALLSVFGLCLAGCVLDAPMYSDENILNHLQNRSQLFDECTPSSMTHSPLVGTWQSADDPKMDFLHFTQNGQWEAWKIKDNALYENAHGSYELLLCPTPHNAPYLLILSDSYTTTSDSIAFENSLLIVHRPSAGKKSIEYFRIDCAQLQKALPGTVAQRQLQSRCL